MYYQFVPSNLYHSKLFNLETFLSANDAHLLIFIFKKCAHEEHQY